MCTRARQPAVVARSRPLHATAPCMRAACAVLDARRPPCPRHPSRTRDSDVRGILVALAQPSDRRPARPAKPAAARPAAGLQQPVHRSCRRVQARLGPRYRVTRIPGRLAGPAAGRRGRDSACAATPYLAAVGGGTQTGGACCVRPGCGGPAGCAALGCRCAGTRRQGTLRAVRAEPALPAALGCVAGQEIGARQLLIRSRASRRRSGRGSAGGARSCRRRRWRSSA